MGEGPGGGGGKGFLKAFGDFALLMRIPLLFGRGLTALLPRAAMKEEEEEEEDEDEEEEKEGLPLSLSLCLLRLTSEADLLSDDLATCGFLWRKKNYIKTRHVTCS